jgi:carbon storage regulator
MLSRNVGESIHIGEDVKLTVLENDWRQVRIGIATPKSMPVHRSEIYHKIKQGDEDENR